MSSAKHNFFPTVPNHIRPFVLPLRPNAFRDSLTRIPQPQTPPPQKKSDHKTTSCPPLAISGQGHSQALIGLPFPLLSLVTSKVCAPAEVIRNILPHHEMRRHTSPRGSPRSATRTAHRSAILPTCTAPHASPIPPQTSSLPSCQVHPSTHVSRQPWKG